MASVNGIDPTIFQNSVVENVLNATGAKGLQLLQSGPSSSGPAAPSSSSSATTSSSSSTATGPAAVAELSASALDAASGTDAVFQAAALYRALNTSGLAAVQALETGNAPQQVDAQA